VTLQFDSASWTAPVRLDGKRRFAPVGPHELSVATVGHWNSDDELLLDLDTVANVNHLLFNVHFGEKKNPYRTEVSVALQFSDSLSWFPRHHLADLPEVAQTSQEKGAIFSEVEDAVGQRIPTLADGGVLSAVVLSIPGGQHVAERKRKRWVRSVTTDSTHPPPGLFKKKAATIARVLASKRVSPKGPQSGMRMLTYFINRGGRGLSKSRRAELERAKRLLSKRVRQTRANSRRSK
jgi:Protein of unknown function (DUF3175)